MAMTASDIALSACADAFIVKAEQQADTINTNINFFNSIFLGETPVLYELTTLNVYTAADNGLVRYCRRTDCETGCSLFCVRLGIVRRHW